LLGHERKPQPGDDIRGSLLGPRFSNAEIRSFLEAGKIRHRYIESEEALLRQVVAAMLEGKVIGWFQDRMEFGPRALGARSILGDARNPAMQSQMNLRIKYRESFRPFAPSVMEEEAAAFFDLDRPSPYMLLVAPVREEKRSLLTPEQQAAMRDPDLRKRVNVLRSEIPAVTHVDMSARVQTVDEPRNGRYYRLIREFKRQTGTGVIINTSFNIRGEPIVCTPQEAYRCFMGCEMDVLVLENCVLFREEQPQMTREEREQYVRSFKLD